MQETYLVNQSTAGLRLDKALAVLSGHKRSRISELIASGSVSVGGKSISKPSFKPTLGQHITVNHISSFKINPMPVCFKILYEDLDLQVIDKPAGILTHATTKSNEYTVADYAKTIYLDQLTDERSGIVHRLDRNTSGAIVIAKNKAAEDYMKHLFLKRLVQKTYLGVVLGHPSLDKAVIDLPIGRALGNTSKRRVAIGGRQAQTSYGVIESWSGFSLLELKPSTGRMHQLRIHLASLGHPIVGDHLYNPSDKTKLGRHLLHAYKLNFTLPSGQNLEITCMPPKIFTDKTF